MTKALKLAFIIAAVFIGIIHDALADEAVKPLLTQEQAVERVRSLIGIPAGFELSYSQRSDLDVSEEEFLWPEFYAEQDRNTCWWLRWTNPNAAKESDNFIAATVDATNGDILEYDSGADESVIGEVVYSEEDAAALANAFLAQIGSPHVSQCEQWQPSYDEYDSGRRHYFVRYGRILDGISYQNDCIVIYVDARNGKITHYDTAWSPNPEYPDFAGIITPQQAEQAAMEDAARRGWTVIPPINTELVMNSQFVVYELATSYDVSYGIYNEYGEPEGVFCYVAAHPNSDGSVRIIHTEVPMRHCIGVKASGEEDVKPKKAVLPEVKLIWVRSLPGVAVQWLGKEGAELKFKGQTYRLVPGNSVVDTPRKRVVSRSKTQLVNGRLMVPEDLCKGLGIKVVL